MKEMAAQGVFTHKAGSRERGQVWQIIEDNLNALGGHFTVISRSVRERFTMLMRKHKAKTNQHANGTGLGGGEPTDDSDARVENDSEAKKANDEKDKQKALDMRKKAMERIGETKKRHADEEGKDKPKEKRGRRTNSDTMDFLMKKLEMESERQDKERQKQRRKKKKGI